MIAALGWGAVLVGGALVVIGWFAFRADRNRVRVADPFADPFGDVPAFPPRVDPVASIRDLNRERNIAKAVRTGIPCRPVAGVVPEWHTRCEVCGRGPCQGVERVIG
ncbi:hypothetical protein [Bradyrhizobium sp.]|uniref:hypothetical protein n=1 Tax=Bradyrhizobium sp. TaxID=376 RepID=UPI00141D3392|nr:hypothetical protein [Bradyrhizobium sp.]EDG7819936.1 hypothetical protein [Salmonella enterica subsp. enterica serovar Senftenberg]MCA3567259.1 hypothetical protein [Bradyrhizobium sp.]MCA3575791.1 hypothetical protein [Bradyrhizobium sp.]